jgi:glutamate---cysteine ligase / carboxylate-amine ligase
VDTRTVGVEEELLLIDPATRSVSSRARDVLREHAAEQAQHAGGTQEHVSDQLDKELFRHQLEIRSAPSRDLDLVVADIVAGRRTAGEAAAALDLAVAVCASVPLAMDEPVISDNDRYRDMAETFGQVARRGTTCGMHVHVAIDSAEEGVGCIDRITPWLPVLLAVSTNSPYDEGRDSGYASWRTQQWSTWPSAGPTEPFGSAAGYRRVCERMIASGAARDAGMLYFDARLSEGQPTLEVRILDAVTDPDDVGLLAALVRALVETAADGWPEALPVWRAEELRAARWRASRYGLAERLLDPVTHELRPAREVLSRLVELVSARLEAAGDADRVARGVERVLHATGATRQRAAYERTGSVEGVVDDVLARTTASWVPSGAGSA